MKNLKLWMTAAGVVSCLSLATATFAQEASPSAMPKGKAVVSSVSVTATVTKINQKTREVTLKADDGQKYSFVADPAVQNLAQVKKGDVVTVTYTEAVIYEVKKGGQAGGSASAAAVAAPMGSKPAGGVAAQATLTVKITAIDASIPSITFATAAGDTRTFKVKDPAKLEGVKVGDTVAITYTEALALKVEEKPKK